MIKEFTGINAPYEEPSNPEIVIDTENESVEESVENRCILKRKSIFIKKKLTTLASVVSFLICGMALMNKFVEKCS